MAENNSDQAQIPSTQSLDQSDVDENISSVGSGKQSSDGKGLQTTYVSSAFHAKKSKLFSSVCQDVTDDAELSIDPELPAASIVETKKVAATPGRASAIASDDALSALQREPECSDSASPEPMLQRYLSVNDVALIFGVNKATIWNWTKNNSTFPKPIKLSPNTTRWVEAELIRFQQNLVKA